MRLSFSKSKNATQLYVIKDYTFNKKRTTKIVEKLGSIKELQEKHPDKDPIEWAKEYIKELNKKEKEEGKEVIIKYSPTKHISHNNQIFFNAGYLFLEDLYYKLGLNKICKSISENNKTSFDLNSILSRLIYSRIIYPSSKLNTFKLSNNFLEKPNFELHHIYRALDVINNNSDYIQSQLYKNSFNIIKRDTSVLYYDCTNYFFELENENGIKQYGFSKEHRPNPIVQMGLFMDGNGIPLAFSINKGNTNEQTTLKPLEKKIIKDFELSKFVVCTDAGLASNTNRKFNNIGNRAFITTQSIKKTKKFIKDWIFDDDGWKLPNSNKIYNLSSLKKLYEENETSLKNKVFYKERWINENDLEQRLIVSFSFKYRNYQRKIRNKQIERATKKITTDSSRINISNQNDYKRFIIKTSHTKDGEIASKNAYSIDINKIYDEARYDGYYAVCTNLEDSIEKIININKNRWEIEENFRIMKSDFKARPVYLSRDDRIKAHFMTCYISLLIYRILEKKLNEEFTSTEIINTLRNMNLTAIKGEGYIPSYTRDNLTDKLHETFNFRTDYQITKTKKMKEILKFIKN